MQWFREICINSLSRNINMKCFDSILGDACKEIDEDSDVAELGQLQEKLLSLDNENFEETRDWITKSMFCQSEEGMHDMIYTFYLIAAARSHDQKSLIFSRMIASLYESRRSNELLNQIPKQCEELLVLTEDMDIEDLVQCLIDNKLLEKSKYKAVIQRKKHRSVNFTYCSIFSDKNIKRYEKIGNFMNDFCILYPNSYYGDQQGVSAIKNDDIKEFQHLCSEDVNFDYNQEFKLTFRDYSFVFKLIEYAAFNGSINCFKYLLLNGAKLSQRIVRCALYGGNIEIIRILEQNNMDLSGGIECANNCFHNEIIDWLVDTKDVKLDDLVSSENVHVLRMMSNKKCDIRVSFFKTGSIILTRYFFSCFIDPKVKKFVFFNACMSGNIGLVKYLHKNLSCYVSNISKSMNSFHIAVLKNRIEVAEYLINLGGFSYIHSEYNMIMVAIENKSLEMLKILVSVNGIPINKNVRNKVVMMNDPEIFEILFQKEWIRNRFQKVKLVQTCTENNYQNTLAAMLSLDGMFDSYCNEIDSIDSINIGLIKALEAIVNKPEKFQILESKKFKNVNQFKEWIFLLFFRKKIEKVSNRDSAGSFLNCNRIKMTDELFKKCFNNSVKNHLTLGESNDMFEWLSNEFPELMRQNTEEILNYSRNENEILPKHSKDDILRFLIYLCEKGNAVMLSQYESILPDFVNQIIDDKTMISAEVQYREIIKILLKIPELDFQHNSESPVEFLLCENDSFDLIIDHPKADLNCVGSLENQKISLLMRISVTNNYNNFDSVLKKDGVDVNFMMMVKDKSGEYFPCYSVIHYLVCSQKTKMLERLLEYPTVDANIASVKGVTPLACAIHLNDVRIINLILSKLKGSFIALPYDFSTNVKIIFEYMSKLIK